MLPDKSRKLGGVALVSKAAIVRSSVFHPWGCLLCRHVLVRGHSLVLRQERRETPLQLLQLTIPRLEDTACCFHGGLHGCREFLEAWDRRSREIVRKGGRLLLPCAGQLH